MSRRDLKLLAVSDLHVERGEQALEIAREVASQEADVLVVGGDLADNPDDFLLGLEALSSFEGQKLLFLGNNDLETIQTSLLTAHEGEFEERLAPFGFHLLDAKPCQIGEVAFVGHCGWYDGSLFRPLEGEPSSFERPNDLEMAHRRSRYYFAEKQFCGRLPEGLGPLDFFEHSLKRIRAHLRLCEEDEGIHQIVLGIHHVPDRAFLRVGTDTWRNFLDFYMGSDRYAECFRHKKVSLGLVGHTHRFFSHVIGETPVYNVSSTEQFPFQIFTLPGLESR